MSFYNLAKICAIKIRKRLRPKICVFTMYYRSEHFVIVGVHLYDHKITHVTNEEGNFGVFC